MGEDSWNCHHLTGTCHRPSLGIGAQEIFSGKIYSCHVGQVVILYETEDRTQALWMINKGVDLILLFDRMTESNSQGRSMAGKHFGLFLGPWMSRLASKCWHCIINNSVPSCQAPLKSPATSPSVQVPVLMESGSGESLAWDTDKVFLPLGISLLSPGSCHILRSLKLCYRYLKRLSCNFSWNK
jgi:hypothetical protein